MEAAARESMRHLGTAVLASALLAGCAAPPGDHGADGGVVSEASGDAVDPSCHWDCFGSHYCVDGEVHTVIHAPVPCSFWTGACPEYVTYTCERGCRTDGVASASHGAEPVVMCEEGRPKVEGDPCTDDSQCSPPSATGPFEEVDRHHLECDGATGTCVPIADPTPPDWLAPCAADLSHLLDPDDGGYVYGFVVDPGCAGGTCSVIEREDCVQNACTMPCTHDWECPDGAYCRDRRDRTQRDGGASTITRVCEPATYWPADVDCR